VLLDALQALEPHRSSLVLVGAQAVYLRSISSSLQVAPYTTDADLALNPAHLAERPALESLLADAGFRPAGPNHIGSWVRSTPIQGREEDVQVDLMVPAAVAAGTGRRSVELPGHDAHATRRTVGLEAALVDHGPLTVSAMELGDPRVCVIEVAGPGALLVAKLHKIVERLEQKHRRDRTSDKDAADVFRLFQGTPAEVMAEALHRARAAAVSRAVTETALEELRPTFGRRGGPGLTMAIDAIGAGPEEADTIEAAFVAYVERVARILDCLPQ
jgi:hypothetical protein